MFRKSPSTPITVHDIKEEFRSRFGRLSDCTEEQNEFLQKLNELGNRSIDLAEQLPDIDAATVLSVEEIAQLRAEMEKLIP